METCDDCGQEYPGPAYRTFEGCELWIDDVRQPHEDCTANTCPDCSGPFLEPDLEHDPRRPAVDFYDPGLHASMARDAGL